MAKVRLTLDGWRCERCSHEWVPRGKAKPRICPKCKSAYWDVSRDVKPNDDVAPLRPHGPGEGQENGHKRKPRNSRPPTDKG
jgi:hypothetical protein